MMRTSYSSKHNQLAIVVLILALCAPHLVCATAGTGSILLGTSGNVEMTSLPGQSCTCNGNDLNALLSAVQDRVAVSTNTTLPTVSTHLATASTAANSVAASLSTLTLSGTAQATLLQTIKIQVLACSATQFVNTSGTTQNWFCQKCTVCDGVNNYQSVAPTATS